MSSQYNGTQVVYILIYIAGCCGCVLTCACLYGCVLYCVVLDSVCCYVVGLWCYVHDKMATHHAAMHCIDVCCVIL